MDTGEAGAAAAPPPRQPGEKVERVRGRATSKQKARKRKSMEKAMAGGRSAGRCWLLLRCAVEQAPWEDCWAGQQLAAAAMHHARRSCN